MPRLSGATRKFCCPPTGLLAQKPKDESRSKNWLGVGECRVSLDSLSSKGQTLLHNNAGNLSAVACRMFGQGGCSGYQPQTVWPRSREAIVGSKKAADFPIVAGQRPFLRSLFGLPGISLILFCIDMFRFTTIWIRIKPLRVGRS